MLFTVANIFVRYVDPMGFPYPSAPETIMAMLDLPLGLAVIDAHPDIVVGDRLATGLLSLSGEALKKLALSPINRINLRFPVINRLTGTYDLPSKPCTS